MRSSSEDDTSSHGDRDRHSKFRVLKYAGLGLVALILLIVLGFLIGVFGTPSVKDVRNEFATVNDTTTTIDTILTVNNPNPIGISLGGLDVNYTVLMNEVHMANGSKHGISIGTGSSTLPFRSYLTNDRIPRWWYTHVAGDEVSDVVIDVSLSHGLLSGRSVSLEQNQRIETDILGEFNDSTTRPTNANAPVVSDPILYLNETAAWYGGNLTRGQTPLEMALSVYNPKRYPYAVTEVGYEIRMNGIVVGEGSSERSYTIPGRSQRTIRATTVINNQRLDESWVSHLERNQVTNLTVDTYVILDPDTTGVLGETVPPLRIDSNRLDYLTTIRTDIFGTKDSDGLDPGGSTGDDESDDGDEPTTPTPANGGTTTVTPTSRPTPTETPTPTPRPIETPVAPTSTPTPTPTAVPTATPTPTPTDDGILPV